MNSYEAVIGLEVHAQLATKSKLFCGCSTAFGAEANTQVCEICAGLPGALPLLNEKAVEYAVRMGLAVECEINPNSIFARKNYMYPDLPSGYQISQFDAPVCGRGRLRIETGAGEKYIGITRIHLENDAGKNIHPAHEKNSYVDLNRCGMALIEIVSDPDMRSAEEAVAYLKGLHTLVTWLGVCDGNMEEGSFRCDANISLRKKGTAPLGVRTELKNLNSFRNVQRAIEYEIARQRDILEEGGTVLRETRLYDAGKNCTQSMREKEEAHDYRYFPDPDLLPVSITTDQLEQWRAQLPELPGARRARFIERYALKTEEADIICGNRALAEFFEQALTAGAAPRSVAKLVIGPLLRELNQGKSLETAAMRPEFLGELARMVDAEHISAKMANDSFSELFDSGGAPEIFMQEKGMAQISDSALIEQAVTAVLAANPAEVEAYRGGKTRLMSFFVGQIMREMRGKANPALVNDLLRKKLG
ncbi:MAG: Asp-tRNA(Asn)/Glu-tRNA(Gln) amidotransferase subunit GatB [Deltaproteobacteria bacterium]|jgi:aspartyl-tRNA(Asn)/glutamyl-tRNA(Gln) amidotransferase subunit B|nr:Asp-tRNA(Asn)/Glu-tRNA(Gln) amidotransferase subunit GatB [Deltaproteobacteria bacterium]